MASDHDNNHDTEQAVSGHPLAFGGICPAFAELLSDLHSFIVGSLQTTDKDVREEAGDSSIHQRMDEDTYVYAGAMAVGKFAEGAEIARNIKCSTLSLPINVLAHDLTNFYNFVMADMVLVCAVYLAWSACGGMTSGVRHDVLDTFFRGLPERVREVNNYDDGQHALTVIVARRTVAAIADQQRQMMPRADRVIHHVSLDAPAWSNEQEEDSADGTPLRDASDAGSDMEKITAAIRNYGRCSQWFLSLHLLDQLRTTGMQPNIFTYHAALSAMLKGTQTNNALDLLEEMPSHRVEPDDITYNTVIEACAKGSTLQQTTEVLNQMQARRIEPSASTYDHIIAACHKGHHLEELLKFRAEARLKGFNLAEESK